MRKLAFFAAVFVLLVGATTAHAATAPVAKPKPKVDTKQQLIINVLIDFKNVFGSNPTNAEKAWWRARISCGEITTEKALLSSMSYTKSKKVRIGSPNICGRTVTSSSSGSTSGGTVIKKSVEGITANPNIRVGIYSAGDGKTAIKVTATGAYQVRAGDKVLGKLDDSNTVSVTYTGDKYHVRGSGLQNDVTDPVRFIPANSNVVVQIISYNDKSKSIPGKNYNKFRGSVEVNYDKEHKQLWAVNELKTELYVRGLGETSGDGPVDYLKALGIAARTYALYHKVVIPRRDIFDIGSTSDDQIYRGYEFEILTPRFSSILNDSSGIILTTPDNNQPIASVYFSDSDGHTRSAKEVWNSSRFPYLQSVADPHHSSSSCLGHCVGMSAQGAFGFAKADGWDFKKILNYYYKGVQLVKAY